MSKRTWKKLDYFLVLVGLVFLVLFVKLCIKESKAEDHAPTDSVALMVNTYDSSSVPTLADADSVQFFYTYKNILFYNATLKVANYTTLLPGIYQKNVRASKAGDSIGVYVWIARAYKYGGTKTGGKSWSWTVKNDASEPLRLAKHIYMTTTGNGGNDGLTWATAVCSLRTALTKCTGGKDYFIHIAPGTYSAQTCTVTTAYIRILGSGWDRTTLTGTSGFAVIKVNHTGTGIEIANLTFSNSTDASSYDIILTDVDGYWIHDCRFNSGYEGIYVTSGAHKGLIENCFIFAAYYDGIAVSGNQCWVRENVIDSLGHVAADGLSLFGRDNVATRNYVRTTTGNSIRLDNAGGNNNLAADNYAWNATVNQDYYLTDSKVNLAFLGNHGRSEIDTVNTIEEDIANGLVVAVSGNVVDSATNGSTVFKTDLTNAVNDHYNGQFIIFTSGVNAGQTRIVLDYLGSPRYLTVAAAFEVEPTAGDRFKILYLY